MPLDFPLNPVNGQTYLTYTYDTSIASWRSNPLVKGPAYISDAPPLLAANGDVWFSAADGTLFVRYDNNWVEARSDETITPGSVVQVVHNSYSTEIGTSSTSYVTTNLTATITPKFVNSKILVMPSTNVGIVSATAVFTVYRGDVSLGINLAPGTWGYGRVGSEQQTNWTTTDSPLTTSSVTYTLAMKTAGSGVIYAQNASTPGRITLMEVAQ